MLKRILIILVIVAVGLLSYCIFVENIFAQRLSPKDQVEFALNDLKLEVGYNRPSKKEREVFGALVPYNEVWRTGANEATTFSTNKDLTIMGIWLPKGDYTLWTIPQEDKWNVIFNTKQYPWGVDDQMQPMRESKYDILEIDVPVEKLQKTVEQFTISFDNSTGDLNLTMAWDNVKIAVPLNYQTKATTSITQ